MAPDPQTITPAQGVRPPPRQDPERFSFKVGFAARMAGKPLQACPHGDAEQALRLAWVRGWLARLATEPARRTARPAL